MGRVLVLGLVLGLVLVVGCGPASEREALWCERAPECLSLGACDLTCVQRVGRDSCCDCLAERGCMSASADGCVTNLEEHETFWIEPVCLEETSPCAPACQDAFSPGAAVPADRYGGF